jgi:hypothetical protein
MIFTMAESVFTTSNFKFITAAGATDRAGLFFDYIRIAGI